MVWFLGGTAVLCLLYYIIIVIYSGVSTSFALIWPCLAIFLGLLAAGWWFGSQHEGRIPVWIGVSVGTVCADSGDHGGFDRLERHYGDGTAGGLCDRAGSTCARHQDQQFPKAASGSGDRVFGGISEHGSGAFRRKRSVRGDQRGAGDVRIFTVQRDSGG